MIRKTKILYIRLIFQPLLRCLEIFLKFKVDIAEVTYSNDTVMTLMISEVERTEDRTEESEKFRDLVRLLVEHEALDPNMAKMGSKKNKRNKTPLHYVVEFCTKKDVEALGTLDTF